MSSVESLFYIVIKNKAWKQTKLYQRWALQIMIENELWFSAKRGFESINCNYVLYALIDIITSSNNPKRLLEQHVLI